MGRLRGLASRWRARASQGADALRGAARTLASHPLVHAVVRVARIITPLGRATAALMLVTAGVGIIAKWQEMRAVALFLALSLALASLWLFSRPAWRVERTLLEHRITVGDRVLVHVKITNVAPRPAPPTMMRMSVGTRIVSLMVPPLGPGGSHEEGFVLPTYRRSIVVLGPVCSVVGDPLGLARIEKSWTGPLEVYIQPRTIRLNALLKGFIKDIEGHITRDLSSSDVSFHAIRDYAVGDDRRNIHWRSTAHSGSLMVRQFEETRRASLIVILSSSPGDYTTEEDFETAISVACSLALKGMSEGTSVHLLAGGEALPTSSPMSLLNASCSLDLHGDDPVDVLVPRALAAFPSSSVVVIVTGQEVPDERLARARSALPPSIAVLAIVCGPDGLVRRHIRSTPLFALSALEQLPRALGALD